MSKSWCVLAMTVFLGAAPLLAQNQNQDDAAAARTVAGCGPGDVMFNVSTTDLRHPVARAEEGKALVYFFVDYVTAPTMRVGADGNWVGATKAKSYLYFQLAPGEHNVCTEWQSAVFKQSSERVGEAIHLTTEAGKKYYLRLNFSYQRMHLELSDEAEGHFLIGSSLYAMSQPKKK
jgi:Protein of unknown function (DUF2846)